MGAVDAKGDTDLGQVLPLPQAPDGIEFRHLRSFVAVAEELNFGRAASRLYVSQPALSRQIRALERLVGCALLRRSTHQVELTLAGEALLDRAHRLLHEVDDTVATVRSVGGEIEGRIARLWEPIYSIHADADLQTLRNASEDLHAKMPVPEVDVRAVNAGGVPAFVVTPQPDMPVTILFFHGGGYVMGSAFGHRHLAGALAIPAETGVLVPEYRLAPEHPFPAALEDALRAYLWMLDTGTDPADIVVAGDSAGAALAFSLMIALKRDGLPLPAGAIAMCPGVDPTFDGLDELPAEPEPVVSMDQIRSFLASYLGDHPPDDELVNALHADLTGFPPLLVQGGTGDVFVRDAHRLAERARAHGVDVRLELYPVPTHDFHIFWSFLPEAADALHQAGHFARTIRTAAGESAAER
jgi:epsilon-lactone hydrolase